MSTSKIEPCEQFDLDMHKADTEDRTKQHDSTSTIERNDDDRISDNHSKTEDQNGAVSFHDMIDEGKMDKASNETKSKEETMDVSEELNFDILTEGIEILSKRTELSDREKEEEQEVDNICH